MNDTTPTRGFPVSEYRTRLRRAQAKMSQAGLAALLLTTEPEIRYFTGFLTRFWESPTRPWFLVVPASGDPVAVIPAIGAPLMAQGWITDIRSWRSPDLRDDGVSLLSEVLAGIAGRDGRIGVPSGHETLLRMPLADFDRLQQAVGRGRFRGDAGIMRGLRMVKSPAEVDRIRAACGVADRAFAQVPDFARPGTPLSQVFRQFQIACLQAGADWVPYLAGGAGPDGYGDVISPATDRPLARGDVLMIDTGLVRDGYFCDFDRNFAVGTASAATQDAHAQLIEATEAGMQAARPGATAAELFHCMDTVLTGGAGGSDAGRYGHGLGMQLTEWPSLIPDDDTVLCEGMVLTLEPGLSTGPGRIMVHEEDIVITADGAQYLSTPAARGIPIAGGAA